MSVIPSPVINDFLGFYFCNDIQMFDANSSECFFPEYISDDENYKYVEHNKKKKLNKYKQNFEKTVFNKLRKLKYKTDCKKAHKNLLLKLKENVDNEDKSKTSVIGKKCVRLRFRNEGYIPDNTTLEELHEHSYDSDCDCSL